MSSSNTNNIDGDNSFLQQQQQQQQNHEPVPPSPIQRILIIHLNLHEVCNQKNKPLGEGATLEEISEQILYYHRDRRIQGRHVSSSSTSSHQQQQQQQYDRKPALTTTTTTGEE